MIPYVNIGDTLFHKYLGEIKVTSVSDNGIKANTKLRGILDFNNYDFGRVLYFTKDHSNKAYKTYGEYIDFYKEEKQIKEEYQIKIKQEYEKRLQIQREENQKKEIERQKEIEIQQEKERIQKQIEIQQEEKKQKLIENRNIIINQNLRLVNLIGNSEINNKKNYNEFKDKVEELKERYKFRGLWHFTDFTNLDSIFYNGKLSSRNTCLKNKLNFIDGANHNIINRANHLVHSCTRFYYRPKSPTLYDNEGIKPIEYSNEIHIPRPVYLLFSEELIYHKDTIYSNGNATNSPIGDNIIFFNSMDWDNIFHDTWFQQEDRDYIVNKRQAELLSKTPVSLKYLEYVIFRSKADIQQAINKWGENSKFLVNENYFSDKSNLSITDWRYNNFITNYKIDYSADKLIIVICFKRPIQNYSITYGIEDKKGNYKTDIFKNKLEVKLKDELNSIISEIKNAIKIKLTFSCKPLEGDIIKIYFNGILCIEETVRKGRN